MTLRAVDSEGKLLGQTSICVLARRGGGSTEVVLQNTGSTDYRIYHTGYPKAMCNLDKQTNDIRKVHFKRGGVQWFINAMKCKWLD